MNINRCLLFFVFFTLGLGNINAQSSERATNPEKGYVITNDNDTISGTIDCTVFRYDAKKIDVAFVL